MGLQGVAKSVEDPLFARGLPSTEEAFGAALDPSHKLLETSAELNQFLDAAWAARFFEAIPEVALPGSGPLACEVVPLKLRPRRGTGVILYRVRPLGPDALGPRFATFVGKITSSANPRGVATGQKAFGILKELWQNGFATGPMRVPPPIVFIPASNFMLVGAVQGTDLMTLFKEASLTLFDSVRRAGEWLAKLHASPIVCPPARPLERQRAKVYRVAAEVDVAFPTLAPKTRDLRQKIAEEIESVTPDELTPVHGDFLMKNLIVDDGALTALDFEEGGMFDPAKDVGKFLANLAAKGAAHGVRFDIARLQRGFLNAYLNASGRERSDRAAAYHALGLLKHALRQPTADDALAWLEKAKAVLEEASR